MWKKLPSSCRRRFRRRVYPDAGSPRVASGFVASRDGADAAMVASVGKAKESREALPRALALGGERRSGRWVVDVGAGGPRPEITRYGESAKHNDGL